MPSWRVHGRYRRRLVDAPHRCSPVVIEFSVRRFKCVNSRCPAVTFVVQIQGLTSPHARVHPTASNGAHLDRPDAGGPSRGTSAGALSIRVAKDTLLHLLRAVLKSPPAQVRVLGVDDFALRKGDSYATILIDLEARRPLDVLPGRDAAPLADWLRGHPEDFDEGLGDHDDRGDLQSTDRVRARGRTTRELRVAPVKMIARLPGRRGGRGCCSTSLYIGAAVK
ncbi:hypothetical protein SALBM311S_07091 [Streptomyces alboniger]